MTWFGRMFGCLALAVLGSAGEEAPAPRATGTLELHGTFRSERFWARLQPASADFGGHRVLELVYRQPPPADLGGTVLIDHPLILLDAADLAIRGWNDAHSGAGLSTAEFVPGAKPPGYRVALGRVEGEGDQAVELTTEKAIAIPAPAWELRLAPILLALAYRQGAGPRATAAVDLFAKDATAVVRVAWTDDTLTIGDATWTIKADEQGRLHSLVPADGGPALLTVTAWLKDG